MKGNRLKYGLIKIRQYTFVCCLILLVGVSLTLGLPLPIKKREIAHIEIIQEKSELTDESLMDFRI